MVGSMVEKWVDKMVDLMTDCWADGITVTGWFESWLDDCEDGWIDD